MWTKHIVVAAAAFAAVFGAAGDARAQSSTGTGQEDRQADRRADRQEDRLAERRVEAMEVEEGQERAEVRLQAPRTATGAIDVDRLLALVRDQIAQGAREIQFRGATLTAGDVQNLLLSTSPTQNLLAEIAALLPNDGVERKITLRGAADIRVTRQPDGSLRARIENVDLGDLTAAQRAALAQQLAALGFDRVRTRGVDSAGNRVRLEFRADRGLAQNDDRRIRVERPERMERPERAQRPERAEHAERPDRSGPH
jgi:hypothetical protein